jgi:hypothetical protein
VSLETYVTLQEAVQRCGLDAALLTHALNKGRIRGGKLNGTVVLLEKDAERMAQQAEREHSIRHKLRAKVAHLEGNPISMGAAARKYGLTQPSISRWTQAGYIRILHRGRQGKATMVDESDVAYAKEVAQFRQAGQGKEVFATAYRPDWF